MFPSRLFLFFWSSSACLFLACFSSTLLLLIESFLATAVRSDIQLRSALMDRMEGRYDMIRYGPPVLNDMSVSSRVFDNILGL